MAEVTNLKQVLAQALEVERLQEKSRRQSEVDQQQTTRRLVDQAEIHGRQVAEAPESEEPRLDPEQEGQGRPDGKPSGKPPEKRSPKPGTSPSAEAAATEAPPAAEAEDAEVQGGERETGRRVDLRA